MRPRPQVPAPGSGEERVRVAVPGAGAVSVAVSGDASAPVAVVLAHGAGNDMDSDFMRALHAGLAGRACLVFRFNFLYKEAGRKLPDARPLLEKCFRAVADFARGRLPAGAKLALGGKSMGGRIASHLAASGYPAGALIFFGYPLHPPGKPEQLRDRHLDDIRCPMLFLSGTRDPFATRDLLDLVVRRLGARATLHAIEGGDHSFRVKGRPQQEVNAEALDVAAQWLKGCR